VVWTLEGTILEPNVCLDDYNLGPKWELIWGLLAGAYYSCNCSKQCHSAEIYMFNYCGYISEGFGAF